MGSTTSLVGRVAIDVDSSSSLPLGGALKRPSLGGDADELIVPLTDAAAAAALSGLSSHEARQRLCRWGPNDAATAGSHHHQPNHRPMLSPRMWALAFVKGLPRWMMETLHDSMVAKYFEQFQNPLIALLLASAAVSLLLGQIENGLSILFVRMGICTLRDSDGCHHHIISSAWVHL